MAIFDECEPFTGRVYLELDPGMTQLCLRLPGEPVRRVVSISELFCRAVRAEAAQFAAEIAADKREGSRPSA